MEYAVGVRLQKLKKRLVRIEEKVDKVLAQLGGMTPAELQQTTQQLVAAADALDALSGATTTRPKKGAK